LLACFGTNGVSGRPLRKRRAGFFARGLRGFGSVVFCSSSLPFMDNAESNAHTRVGADMPAWVFVILTAWFIGCAAVTAGMSRWFRFLRGDFDDAIQHRR
jgi:hypothetical protein